MVKESGDTDVALFIDLENVQPGEIFLVDELLNYAKQFGRIVIARAFADFHKYDPKIAQDLVAAQFELIHLPHNRTQKNSVDILMAVNATNTLVLFPNIQNYILVSGDYDFRGLVQTLQMHGKSVHMVCDPSNTRTELLRLVDSFQDMYELSDLAIETHPKLQSNEDMLTAVLKKLTKYLEDTNGSDLDMDEEPELSKNEKIKLRAKEILKEKKPEPETLRTKVNTYSKSAEEKDVHQKIELALDKLQEAIAQSCQEKHANQADHNAVLTRLKVIYPDLENDILEIAPEMGINTAKWYSGFLKYAEQRGKISIKLDGATYYLSTDKIGESETSKRTRLFFEEIQDAIQKYGKHDKVDISRLAQVMNDNYETDYGDLGFKSFKSALFEAQKKKLISMHRSKENMSWIVELSK